jgi:nickel transport protein
MLLDRKSRLLWGAALAVLALGIVVALPMVSQVWAHKVNVFAWVEGDTVFVEGYFPGGKKSQDSLVEVFNPAGSKLLEGRTNETGEFSFKIPERTDLRIVLTSSVGHKNDFIVPASDLQEVESSPSSPAQSFAESAKDSSAHPADLSQLEGMIDRALDRKLDPVIKLIRDTRREGPTVTEIIGGIGYIVGLFGVFMYFKSRKKKERGQRSEVRGQQNIDKK